MHALVMEEGRAVSSLKILPAITPIVGKSRQHAHDLQQELDGLIPSPVAISKLEALLGNVDLSGYSPDGPLPVIPETPSSTRQRVVELAAREQLSIRELARRVAAGRTSRTVVGTGEEVADELASWYLDGAADGFVIAAPFLPGGLADFVDAVVPQLQARGLFRREYTGNTLRDHLGLARPENAFANDPSLAAKPEIW
jgi:N-acetyl-S-(2-succino)cysteine monooxygenase